MEALRGGDEWRPRQKEIRTSPRIGSNRYLRISACPVSPPLKGFKPDGFLITKKNFKSVESAQCVIKNGKGRLDCAYLEALSGKKSTKSWLDNKPLFPKIMLTHKDQDLPSWRQSRTAHPFPKGSSLMSTKNSAPILKKFQEKQRKKTRTKIENDKTSMSKC